MMPSKFREGKLIKVILNKIVAKWSRRMCHKRALILDGPHAKTAKALGIPRERIDSPNCNVDDYLSIAKQGVSNAHLMNVGKFIKNMTTSPNVIYLDYMATLLGNRQKQIFPLEDIHCLLEKNKRKRIILAFTVCQRRKKSTDETAQEIITSRMEKLFRFTKWKVVDSFNHTYRPAMSFNIYELNKVD
jgi:hypothetical protein